MTYSKQGYKLYSREEMKNMAINWYNEHGKIVLRDLRHKNNLPSQTQVINEFGSFQNFLLECNIPLFNKRIFDRKIYSNEELLDMYAKFVKEYLKTHIFLPTHNEVNKSDDLPSASEYTRRFGGFEKINSLIGYNQKEFNKNALEKDMLYKYKRACNDYGHTLNSREITKLCKENNDYIYSTEAYLNHFGSIHNLQKICGLNLTVPGKGMSKEEMINRLKKLSKELGRRPVQTDLIKYDYMPSSASYIHAFGSFKSALKLAGITNIKIYQNDVGKLFRSLYELRLSNILDTHNIQYENELYYKDIIEDFEKKYRFDFAIYYQNNIYYIEIFGINGHKKYDKKTNEKIKICKDNNIKLIALYYYDFDNKTDDDIYNYLIKYINKIDRKEV